ncbi:hypothetical protein SAY86_012923 [Trapa natans]|uniref:Uncharacterized protein n=1 Tax=Trapa natans TaxID=22666 RepID=A0AAN7R7N2_TRANT|nr:hypothetical protein SAY86_012923 [Trapa natans]
MEPAQIDWKNVQWVFAEDELYEHISAPKWFDFSAPQQDCCTQDIAWFCRPDCNHPTTADDFLESTPKSSKVVPTPFSSWHISFLSLSRFASVKCLPNPEL